MPGRGNSDCVLLLVAVVWALGACRAQPPPAAAPLRALEAGAAIESDLSAPVGHTYRLPASAGEYVHVVVEPREADVALRLSAPDGRERLRLDRAVGDAGREDLAFVADAAGTYRIEVVRQGRLETGRYRLRVRAAQPPSADDRRRAAAFEHESRADAEHRAAQPGALGRACTECQAALQAWRALSAPADTALALRHCARLRTLHGDPAAALRLLEQALGLNAREGDVRAQAQVRAEIADAQGRLWQFAAAAREAERARAAAHATGERWAAALALHVQGDRAAQLGAPGQAVTYYRRALRLWRALGDRRGAALTLTSWGNAETLLGNDDDARDLFRQALVLRHESADVGGQAEDRAYLAWLAYVAGDYDVALFHYQRAAAVLQRLHQHADLAGVLDRQGSALMRLGHFDAALACYRRALVLVRASGDMPGVARVHSNIASVHARRGEWDLARQAYAEARATVEPAGDVEALSGVLFGSAELHRQRGELEDALRDVDQIISRLERLRSRVGVQTSRASYLAARHKVFDLQIELLMTLNAARPGAGHDVRAFEAVEAARALTLRENLAWAGGRRPCQHPQLQQRIGAAQRRLGALRARDAPGSEIERAERVVDDLLSEHDEAGEAPDVPGLVPVSLAEVQRELLDAETLLLTYALGEPHSYLFLVGRERFETYKLPARARIEASARDVAGRLGRSHELKLRSRALRAAADLSKMVLDPVAERLTARQLVIAADGALQYVPFAALPIVPRAATAFAGGDDWPDERVPLLAEHVLAHTPSASVALALRRARARREAPTRTIALLTDPVYELDDERLGATPGAGAATATAANRAARPGADDPGSNHFDRLEHSASEAAAVRLLVEPDQVLDARGFDATRELVLSGRLRDYGILHFAGHGVSNPRRPQLSALVLALRDRRGVLLDGYLCVSDLARLELRADLVVLSACDTALGRELRGEGLFGLTQGFLQAGARRVMVSLWSVNDPATATLMQRFYAHHLGRGLPAAAALRAAQLDVMAVAGLSAPEYWAGFILQGDFD